MSTMQQLTHLESFGLIRLAQLEPELEYLFRHALVQDAAYDSLLKQDRKRLHRAVAEALEQLYPVQTITLAATLAHHYRAAGDQSKALYYLTLAAEHALNSFANQEAEALFQSALTLVTDPADRAPLLRGLGWALHRTQRFNEAIGVWQEGITMYDAIGDFDQIALLYAHAATASAQGRDPDRAVALTQQGVRALQGAPESPGLAVLLSEAAIHLIDSGRIADAVQTAWQAVDLASRVGGAATQVDILMHVGRVLQDAGVEALEMIQQAAEVADAAGLQVRAAEAYSDLGMRLVIDGLDMDQGRNYLQRGFDIYRNLGDRYYLLYPLMLLMMAEMVAGNAEAADRIASDLAGSLAAINNPFAMTPLAGRVFLAIKDYWRGEWSEAERVFEELEGIFRHGKYAHVDRMVHLYHAEMALLLQNRVVARKLLYSAMSILPVHVDPGTGVWACALMCKLNLHDGQNDEARRWLEQAGQIAGSTPRPVTQRDLMEGTAQVAAAEGRWQDALNTFQELAYFLETHRCRLYRAMILPEWADVYLAHNESGDHHRALSLLYEAKAEFEAMSASGWAALIAEKITALELLASEPGD